MRDGWRLALGTLTCVPVEPPHLVDARTARWSLLLAPLATLPLGLAAGLVTWAGSALGLVPLGVAVAAVAVVVAGSRAFHVDGLADTADALTSSYDAERSLAVMRSGDTGPAGVAAVVLVLGAQVAGVTGLAMQPGGPLLVGLAVVLARTAHGLACRPGVPAAPGSRLADPYAGCAPPAVVAVTWLVAAAVLAGGLAVAGDDWWRGPLALLVAALAVGALVRRAVRRLGGVTGDVFGASIEVTLAVLLVGLT